MILILAVFLVAALTFAQDAFDLGKIRNRRIAWNVKKKYPSSSTHCGGKRKKNNN